MSILVYNFFGFYIFYLINFFLKTGSFFFFDFGRWFFCLDLIDVHLLFCFDFLALLSIMLVLLLTQLALYFGTEYMFREIFLNRLLYLLNCFAVSVIFLFICYDFCLILISWECIGLFSFLLVNFYSTRTFSLKAAIKTFVISRLSDFFLFLTFFFLLILFKTTDLSLIFCQTPFFLFNFFFFSFFEIHTLTLIMFCLISSGLIKAAQFCFHTWLPDAMEAPTPASALIHSSTLVIAGIYLILRFSIFFDFSLLLNYFLILIGFLTLAFGALTASFQNDIKKLVAYSTISQIGYLTTGCGFGAFEEVFIYLNIHAINKALLFILVGYIVHYFNNNTDLRFMGNLFNLSPDFFFFLIGLILNLTGLVYSAGFLAKEFFLFQTTSNIVTLWLWKNLWLISFLFSPYYMLIFMYYLFFGPKKITSKNFHTNRFNWHTFFKTQVLAEQQTYLFSKLTLYILFFFWIFISSIGENLLLLIFNVISISTPYNHSFFFSLTLNSIFNFFFPLQLFYFIKWLIFFFFFFINIYFIFSSKFFFWGLFFFFFFL